MDTQEPLHAVILLAGTSLRDCHFRLVAGNQFAKRGGRHRPDLVGRFATVNGRFKLPCPNCRVGFFGEGLVKNRHAFALNFGLPAIATLADVCHTVSPPLYSSEW
ncbi:hypothetical protein [Magnetospirillum gryphiswaldense]|uniref:hypothetical protein n=1 Tax=Magnetospirillum gryphiswaldense TaxID=55518 RepID=UPI00130E0693|nr:hypothetical protein [Magnetospirillum gryphiswaldense]